MQNKDQNLVSMNMLSNDLDLTQAYSSVTSHQVYNEMSDEPVQDYNELTQLKVNLQTLGDLQNRLTFVLREVRYLMKINS